MPAVKKLKKDHKTEFMNSKYRKESEALAALNAVPLPPVKRRSIEDLLNTPAYSSLAYDVYRRRGHQTRFYHIVAWPFAHWWELQSWINQTQWELEQLFGPIVGLNSTHKQVHAGKVMLLAYFEIGPISPMYSPIHLGSAWRTFLATAEPKPED